jgi:polar amino acid transport system substrate-binding protein
MTHYSNAAEGTLRCGWYPWYPYQYVEYDGTIEKLTGLDVRLMQSIFLRIGYKVKYDEVAWKQHVKDIETGRRDIAAGAFITSEREKYAYFSKAYREEYNVIYVRRGETQKYPFDGVEELLKFLETSNFRLGVVSGYKTADASLNAFLDNPAYSTRVIRVPDETVNFQNLMDGEIDGFIADRLAAATLAWRNGWQALVEEHPGILVSNTLHVMFSKKTTDLKLVEKFNITLDEMRAAGSYDAIIREYLFPILLGMTIQKSWFFAVDIIGTIAFAISGLILATRERYSFFGAIVLAALPALGGGMIRDLLVGRHPVGLVRTPIYVLVVLATVTLGYIIMGILSVILRDRQETPRRDMLFKFSVDFFDAVGLATFTIIGVVVAVEVNTTPLWLWGPILAVLTGAGGGILRDTLRSDPEIASLKTAFYPEVALIWGLFLSIFLLWQTERLNPGEIFIGVRITLVGALLTRLAAIHWNIRSIPYSFKVI